MAITNVAIKNFAYSPKDIEIQQGDKVVWTSEDAIEHTVTADNGDFDSGDFTKDDPPFEHAFDTVTTPDQPIKYHCEPSWSNEGHREGRRSEAPWTLTFTEIRSQPVAVFDRSRRLPGRRDRPSF